LSLLVNFTNHRKNKILLNQDLFIQEITLLSAAGSLHVSFPLHDGSPEESQGGNQQSPIESQGGNQQSPIESHGGNQQSPIESQGGNQQSPDGNMTLITSLALTGVWEMNSTGILILE
jgi:hypothetical protein